MHDCVSVLVCMDISIDEFEGNIAQKESKELAPFPSSSAKSAYYIALNVLSSLGGGGVGNAPMVILELPCGRRCGISKSHQKLEYSCEKHVKMLFPLCKIYRREEWPLMECVPFVGMKLSPFVMLCLDVILRRMFGVDGRSAYKNMCRKPRFC